MRQLLFSRSNPVFYPIMYDNFKLSYIIGAKETEAYIKP